MPSSVTNSTLTTAVNKVVKTRYFSIEMRCVSMIPNTTYDIYMDGILMNAFVKPYGKNLGDPIISGQDGRVLFQYHLSIPYEQKYLTTKIDVSGYMDTQKVIELRDPFGRSSFTYLPIGVKSTS